MSKLLKAYYVADIAYRSEVIRLHIDLLALSNSTPALATAMARGAVMAATPR